MHKATTKEQLLEALNRHTDEEPNYELRIFIIGVFTGVALLIGAW